jgi:hypothetical protein
VTVTSALSALLGALEGHDLAPDIHEAIADANAALMRDADAARADAPPVHVLYHFVAEHCGPKCDGAPEFAADDVRAFLRGEHAAEVARLREQVAERDERLARIAECLRQMADWDDYPPANDIFAMALVQVAGIARGDS